MSLKLITAPLELPVTLAEARAHLRVTSTTEDALILALLYAATEHAEDFTRRRFITQTWELVLDRFPEEFALPNPPLQSVSSLKYLDEAHVEQTLASSAYQVDVVSEPGRVTAAIDTSWPSLSEKINAVTLRFVCGYGGATKVPFAIKAAVLLHVEAHFDKDERLMEKLLTACESLLFPYRMLRL
jgi:uncharacterized phiE125 gp8 family phage protein